MDSSGVNGLIEDIRAGFLLPGIGLVIALINIRFTRDRRVRAERLRIALSILLVLFLVFLSALLLRDRSVLVALWNESPALYSFVYSISCVFVIAGVAAVVHWKLRPKLWLGGSD